VTPFILCFHLRHKAADIIDFYHKFTVDVTGVGDVCSFAQMDVQKHGNPQASLLLNMNRNLQQLYMFDKVTKTLYDFL